MSEPTTFITIHEEHNVEDWPDSTASLITRIDGLLAEKVRAYYDRQGEVTVHQNGTEGGYSEFTVEWDWEADLRIGGVVVYRPNYGAYSEHDFTREGLTPKYGNPADIAQHLIDIRDGKKMRA